MTALWNTSKTFLLIASLTALAGGIGYMFGGMGWAFSALGIMAIVNLLAWYSSDSLVLAMHKARRLGPRDLPWLHEMVTTLSHRAGVPKPTLYVIDDPAPNAFATGRSPASGVVAVSTGLLELCSRREIEGVLAHELAHIVHRDILIQTITATLAGAISLLAHLAGYMLMFAGRSSDDDGPNPLVMLVFMILAPLVAALIQMAVSRTREYEADRAGARFAGTPEGLASALAKLGKYHQRAPSRHAEPAMAHLYIAMPKLRGGFSGLFSTHPPIEERIRRLRALT
ncbi:zinc metalloprotease HtpX [Myxococcota bacterium]|nr:zinc metalloprotease HtpX [Myxococcota bacterium]MBU1508820.1 zinc metalloprotease HtpX [Myxococcota bacterium]